MRVSPEAGAGHGRTEALRAFFDEGEIERLVSLRRTVDLTQGTIAYCVYENPFARSGGMFAVADNYSSAIRRHRRDVILLSPCHTKLRTAPRPADLERLGECDVPFDEGAVRCELLEHVRNGVRWVLLRADGFFEGEGGASGTDPYVHAVPARLLRDSLFACAALPYALATAGKVRDVIVHVQDWELAPAALTIKLALLAGLLESAAVVLTSHNPYDHPLPAHALRQITSRPYRGSERHPTVYGEMIRLTDAPITTVSRTFARELTSDPLLASHFADHLQGVLCEHGVIGVDNGLFGRGKPPYSDRAIGEARSGDTGPILRRKRVKRARMLRALSEYHDPRIVGCFDGGDGRPLVKLPVDVPVFLMFGRMDPGQKGFDVLARAIEALPRGRARFVITPIVGFGASAFRDDLDQLAAARRGEVVVYPFRMEQGYREAMAGASYAVMPSLYEPFGAATEAYLEGTPVLARATGGLAQQVTDIDANPEEGTGVLYREAPVKLAGEWRAMEMAEDPARRMTVPAYGAMVAALAAALTRASDIYRSEPLAYGRMLSNLFAKARTFSWDRAVHEYSAVYELAVR